MGLTAILFFLYPSNLDRSTMRDIEPHTMRHNKQAGLDTNKSKGNANQHKDLPELLAKRTWSRLQHYHYVC